MRLVIARCSVDYTGRLGTHLPLATRLLILKGDGSLSIHSETGFKPLNWMSPPCKTHMDVDHAGAGIWTVTHGKSGDRLSITIEEVIHDTAVDLGVEPGLQKDGVEAHLQELLAEHIQTLGEGWSLVRREYGTAIGP